MSPLPGSLPVIAPQSWMADLAFLDDRRLMDIVIPGSHDAATYAMNSRADNNSSQCQELSVLEQLRAGARYLDLRAWQAADGKYWMYHGLAWTSVELATVLGDIQTFLDENDQEVLIATLLIDEKTGIDAGWQWACQQLQAHRATPADVGGQSFAQVTPRALRAAGRRLVLLRSGGAEQMACMNRDGAYGDSLNPENYLIELDRLRIWDDKMWILHLGIPYKGEIHHTMVERARWNAEEFIPRFEGQGPYARWLQRRLNIINVDFIHRYGWVEAIVRLNHHFPKTWPTPMAPQIARQPYSWTLKTRKLQGRLHVQALTTAPFRAQQGRVYVYAAGGKVPADPDSHAAAWCWDDDCQDWDTGLPWQRGMQVLWLAEKSANGPCVFFLTLHTTQDADTACATFSWTLRAGRDPDSRNLVLDADTDAPFRAQQGQLHVYPPGARPLPQQPDGSAIAWQWDNLAHTWNTGRPWRAGQRLAWVAEKSSNGPHTVFLRQDIA